MGGSTGCTATEPLFCFAVVEDFVVLVLFLAVLLLALFGSSVELPRFGGT